MIIMDILKDQGLNAAYGKFEDPQIPPYAIYIGAGQNHFEADDTYYTTDNEYQVEYYFSRKNSEKEAALETAFLDNGFKYEKSEDVYISSEKIYLIYYTLTTKRRN